MQATKQMFNFRYRSPAHMLDVFRTYYGPMNKALAAVEGAKQAGLEADVLELMGRFNRAGAASLVIPSEYLEVVVTRA